MASLGRCYATCQRTILSVDCPGYTTWLEWVAWKLLAQVVEEIYSLSLRQFARAGKFDREMCTWAILGELYILEGCCTIVLFSRSRSSWYATTNSSSWYCSAKARPLWTLLSSLITTWRHWAGVKHQLFLSFNKTRCPGHPAIYSYQKKILAIACGILPWQSICSKTRKKQCQCKD